MNTRAVVFRIKSRRRSGVRWADATTISYSPPNSARIEPAFFPTSASVLEPRTTSTSTGIEQDKEGSRIKACALDRVIHLGGGRGCAGSGIEGHGSVSEEDATGGQVRVEAEDVLRRHPSGEELDFQPRPERRRERALVQPGDPREHGLRATPVGLRDCGGHHGPAQRRVVDAAGSEGSVPADHDVADGAPAGACLVESRTLHNAEEVSLVDIAADLSERAIESCRQIPGALRGSPRWTDLSKFHSYVGSLRGLPLDEVQDRAREHSELRVQRLRAEIKGSDDAADGPAGRVGRVERAGEHLPPDPVALSAWEREELREEVRPPAEDRDGIAHDLAPHDRDVESPRIGSERVAEEQD